MLSSDFGRLHTRRHIWTQAVGEHTDTHMCPVDLGGGSLGTVQFLERKARISGAALVAQMVKNPPAVHETRVRSLGREDPLEKGKSGLPTPVLLPGESHGQRSLVGYSPRGRQELDTTERLTHIIIVHFISIITSAPPRITRHSIPEAGGPALECPPLWLWMASPWQPRVASPPLCRAGGPAVDRGLGTCASPRPSPP